MLSLLWLQVDPSTASTDASQVMHVAITAADLSRSDPSQLILSLPYASHTLDVTTGFRTDKRAVLSGHQVSITLAFGMLAVQAAVSDSSVATRPGARDAGSLKRPLEELASQAAESAVRSVKREAEAAKRRRAADDAPAPEAPRVMELHQMPMPARQVAMSGDEPIPHRGSHSEFTRWGGHSTMSHSAV